jgi:TolB-like protein
MYGGKRDMSRDVPDDVRYVITGHVRRQDWLMNAKRLRLAVEALEAHELEAKMALREKEEMKR